MDCQPKNDKNLQYEYQVYGIICQFCKGLYSTHPSLKRHQKIFHSRQMERMEDEHDVEEEEDDDETVDIVVISDILAKAIQNLEGVTTARHIIQNYNTVHKAFEAQVIWPLSLCFLVSVFFNYEVRHP